VSSKFFYVSSNFSFFLFDLFSYFLLFNDIRSHTANSTSHNLTQCLGLVGQRDIFPPSTMVAVTASLAYIGSWALSGIGFSSAGPVAGTWAAGWMSSAAVATGGAIGQGTTVALLQSAAMGGSPGVAAAIGGAAIGGTVAGAAAIVGSAVAASMLLF
jgi:hypothetical protein